MLRIIFLYFLLLLLLTLPIFSQAINSSYAGIEEKIAMGRLDEALKETEAELTEHPADAKLSLFQAKIWVEKGEALYRQRKFKSAFVYYQKNILFGELFFTIVWLHWVGLVF